MVGLRMNGDEIEVFSDSFTTEVLCINAPPNTTSTNAIDVTDIDGGTSRTFFLISLAGGPFISADDAEGDGDDEIEIALNAAAGTLDNFGPVGTSSSDRWRLGETASGGQAVNLNMDEPADLDAPLQPDADDITMEGVEVMQALNMGGGNDTLDARGDESPGSAEPQFTGPWDTGGSTKQLVPAGGDDHLFSGVGSNWRLEGSLGSDEHVGGAGSDALHLSQGTDADIADGNGGTDTCTYLNHESDLTVDLRLTTAQNTVGAGMDTISDCENLSGGDEDDLLIGTGGDNLVSGGENSFPNDVGNDTLLGLQGADIIDGAWGLDDTVSYAQGSTGPITVSLGTTAPQATGGAGTDTLTDDSSVNEPNTEPDVENLTGSEFADNLTGNGLENAIDGGPGGDTMNLGAGVDDFDAYDGAADTVDCGDGEVDTGVADHVGADALVDCQNAVIDFSPQTSLGAGPADGSTITDTTPTYGLTADEGSSFEYSVDGGSFTACGNPVCTVAALSDGGHNLRFRAKDLDEHEHEDLTPVTRAITIDTTPPAVPALETDPDSPANDNSPRIRGNAAEGTIDVYANATCAGSPAETGTAAELAGAGIAVNVADDTTTQFTAIARDAVDNDSDCSNAITYTEDSTAPNARITRRPPNRLQRRKARYRFSSNEAGVTFQCKLDRRKFKPCKARTLFKKLRPGPHKVKVRAVDAAGNVGPVARDRFVVL